MLCLNKKYIVPNLPVAKSGLVLTCSCKSLTYVFLKYNTGYRLLLMASWMSICSPPPGFDCPPGKVLCLNYCLFGSVVFQRSEFMLSEGFIEVNDSQTVWIKDPQTVWIETSG